MENQTLRAYHFTSDKLRDGNPIPHKGVWLKHNGKVEPCVSGLHASAHPFDALQYATGKFLHLVEVRGDIQWHDNDKIVGRERRIIASIDAEKLLSDFARWNALKVLYLWPDAPDVVVKFLKTGDESLRSAAWSAAWHAARAAARSAAWATAWYAAWEAARHAAWEAARHAARAAGTAGDAARDSFITKSRRKFKQMADQTFKKV